MISCHDSPAASAFFRCVKHSTVMICLTPSLGKAAIYFDAFLDMHFLCIFNHVDHFIWINYIIDNIDRYIYIKVSTHFRSGHCILLHVQASLQQYSTVVSVSCWPSAKVDNIITEPNLTSTAFVMFGTREAQRSIQHWVRFCLHLFI